MNTLDRRERRKEEISWKASDGAEGTGPWLTAGAWWALGWRW